MIECFLISLSKPLSNHFTCKESLMQECTMPLDGSEKIEDTEKRLLVGGKEMPLAYSKEMPLAGNKEMLLNLEGDVCPLPALKLKQELSKLRPGESIRVLYTDRTSFAEFMKLPLLVNLDVQVVEIDSRELPYMILVKSMSH